MTAGRDLSTTATRGGGETIEHHRTVTPATVEPVAWVLAVALLAGELVSGGWLLGLPAPR